MRDVTVTVIGAGVMGLCVACELVARGAAVRLFDQGGAPARHACSWWAGGMLAPDCEGESAEEPVVRLGRRAADWWAGFTPVRRAGSLVVALDRDQSDLARFARRTSGHSQPDAQAIAALEPDLAGRIQAALFFADEAHLDPRAALAALVAHLDRHGVAVTAQAADPDQIAGPVIDCRGLAGRDRLPELRGVKGEMVMLRSHDIALSRPVRLLHPRHPLYIVPRGEGVFMLGATQIETTERSRITARSLLELLSAAYALHPAFAEAEVTEIGTDARPAFPDNLPRIRQRGNVIHANGLFRHGFLLAPAVAQMVAELVINGTRPEFFDED